MSVEHCVTGVRRRLQTRPGTTLRSVENERRGVPQR
ncbi:MAG: hypothetical protein QOI01_3748 [Mycobacterium sp.]|jgi:hypothetical protein|nr:hypothetical protein [Mycobacterium sp.]